MKPETMEKQPPEWEEFLNDVTVQPKFNEIVMDPAIINHMMEICSEENPIGKVKDVFDDEEWMQKIAEAKTVVRRKMKGIRRQCLLLMLSTGDDYHAIAKKLQITYDTVKRHVELGIKELNHHFNDEKYGEFPARQGSRPSVRSALFTIDTLEEKKEFQLFLNRHIVTHIAYSVQNPFREALVVYLSGLKNINRNVPVKPKSYPHT